MSLFSQDYNKKTMVTIEMSLKLTALRETGEVQWLQKPLIFSLKLSANTTISVYICLSVVLNYLPTEIILDWILPTLWSVSLSYSEAVRPRLLFTFIFI